VAEVAEARADVPHYCVCVCACVCVRVRVCVCAFVRRQQSRVNKRSPVLIPEARRLWGKGVYNRGGVCGSRVCRVGGSGGLVLICCATESRKRRRTLRYGGGRRRSPVSQRGSNEQRH